VAGFKSERWPDIDRNAAGFTSESALEPIREFIDDPRVVEIAVNKPGDVYVERFGADYMEHHLIVALMGDEIQNVGERVAAATNQFISRSKPILSAALPTGERIQIVLPPRGTRRWLDLDPQAGGQ